MARTTSKTPLIIVVVLVAIAAVVGIIIAVNSGNRAGENGGGTTQTEGGLTAAELANVNETVTYGDYDAMQALSKSIQNGEKTGAVVEIDGLVSHPGMSYSIVQRNAEDTGSIGTVFTVEGWSDGDYPADEVRVKITGKVVESSSMVFTIQTLPEFVELVK